MIVLLDPEEMREQEIKDELYEAGIRINQDPPRMKVEKKDRGGLKVSSTAELEMEESTVKELMRDNGYVNADVVIREDMDIDRFLDGLMDNRLYIPAVTAVNKSDTLEQEKRQELSQDYLLISASEGENLEELKQEVWEGLGLIRVYMKKKGEEPDREEPLILERGATVEDALGELPGDMADRFKSARVTGPSSDFPQQEVGEGHGLKDEDVLELNLRHV